MKFRLSKLRTGAVEYGASVVHGQVEVNVKSKEVPAGSVGVSGRIVIMDAVHAPALERTLPSLAARRPAVSTFKGNQEIILDHLMAIDFEDAPSFETLEKGHGFNMRRHNGVVDFPGAEWDSCAVLHGRRQAMRIKSEREILKTRLRSVQATCCLASLGRKCARSEELLALVRVHWVVESQFHYCAISPATRTGAGPMCAICDATSPV